jgi:catechol O-methyltransferase
MPCPSNDDPFACFGDDDDDDDDDDQSTYSETTPAASKQRDAECGVLAFHAGTERALVAYVENALQLAEHEYEHEYEYEHSCESVISAVNKFCMERHWMMHIGTDKAAVLQQFLTQCLAATRSTPVQVVELGTYCGYSAIILGQTLQKAGRTDCHIYTVEVNPQHAVVASRLVQLAKLDKLISVLLREEKSDLVNDVLKPRLLLGEKKIDFLFLDHDKDAYLTDLKQLERSLLCVKSYVAADNVVFAQIHDYRNYVNGLAAKGVVETKLVEIQLEYSEPDANALNKDALQDGIGGYTMFDIILLCNSELFALTHCTLRRAHGIS